MVSFQGQKNPQKHKKSKNYYSVYGMRLFVNVNMHKIAYGCKIPFLRMEDLFFSIHFHWQILKIQWNWISHYVKFEMWAVLFYVNTLYFPE